MSNNIIGMYSCFENQLDFNLRVRMVKYENGLLYHTAPLKISREMIEDLKAYGVDAEMEVYQMFKTENHRYFEMTQKDIDHASTQILELKEVFRDMKIRKILS